MTSRRWTPAEDEKLLDLRAQKLSYAGIARRLNRSDTAIQNRLQRLNGHDPVNLGLSATEKQSLRKANEGHLQLWNAAVEKARAAA